MDSQTVLQRLYSRPRDAVSRPAAGGPDSELVSDVSYPNLSVIGVLGRVRVKYHELGLGLMLGLDVSVRVSG